MSPENPDGWTLEGLCRQLITEIEGKCRKIELDRRPVARLVLANNRSIIGYLEAVTLLQEQSMSALLGLGPNQGPLGTPRIGIGSEEGEH
jgi:hypothetical protein